MKTNKSEFCTQALYERQMEGHLAALAGVTTEGPRHNHSFRSSFSAGSTPIFASKYAFFFAFFEIYKKLTFSQANFAEFCRILQNFADFFKHFAKFRKFLKFLQIFTKLYTNFAEICKICLREGDFLVDFEKRWKMRIWTRKSALIQPRTSLGWRVMCRGQGAAPRLQTFAPL